MISYVKIYTIRTKSKIKKLGGFNNMVQPEIYVSLDIGTTSIKVVVAEYMNQQLNVIGVGSEKSEGLSRGVIVDIDKTVEAIQKAIRQAEQKSNQQISRVVVGVPSNQVNIEPCYGMIAVASENREITDKDVDNVFSAAKVRAVPPEREIISVIPEEFIVDGFDGIKDPRGMIGVRLELYADLVTGPKTLLHNIKRCVESAGLDVEDFVVQPYANAYAALSKSEREFGTILIDMGGGQTTVSVFHDDLLKFSFVDHEGGEYITKDISTVLNTSYESAERIKREYGYAIPADTSETERFPVETIGKREPVKVDEHYLSEIIEARLRQTFETIKQPLDQIEAFQLPGGVVVTGGAATLPGALDLAEEVLGVEVRAYVPDYVGLRNPIFTTAVGLVEYAAHLDDIHHVAQPKQEANQKPRRTHQTPAQRVDDSQEIASHSMFNMKPEETHSEQEHIEPHHEGNNHANEGQEDVSLMQKAKDFFEDLFS